MKKCASIHLTSVLNLTGLCKLAKKSEANWLIQGCGKNTQKHCRALFWMWKLPRVLMFPHGTVPTQYINMAQLTVFWIALLEWVAAIAMISKDSDKQHRPVFKTNKLLRKWSLKQAVKTAKRVMVGETSRTCRWGLPYSLHPAGLQLPGEASSGSPWGASHSVGPSARALACGAAGWGWHTPPGSMGKMGTALKGLCWPELNFGSWLHRSGK